MTLLIADATQVIEVAAVESPRAPPAGLSARLSRKGKTRSEEDLEGIGSRLQAATVASAPTKAAHTRERILLA